MILEYASQNGRLTADKKLRYASPKLPLATSFIRRTLYAIGRRRKNRRVKNG